MAIKVAYFRPVGVGPESLGRLERLMRDTLYNGSKSAGFLIKHVEADSIHSSYVQKHVRVQTLTDPLGNEYTARTVQYSVQEILFHLSPPSLAVIRPGVSVRALVGLLGSTTSLKFEPMEWKIDRLCSDVCKLFPGAYVSGVMVSDVVLSTRTFATIRFESSADVRMEVKGYLKIKKPDFVSARVEVSRAAGATKVEFVKGGRVTFPDDCSEKIRLVIMEYLKGMPH